MCGLITGEESMSGLQDFFLTPNNQGINRNDFCELLHYLINNTTFDPD